MAQKALAIDLHLVLRDGGRVLMGVRRNTGFCDGMYHFPAGRLEEDETIVAGAIREAKEELGIDIQPADLELIHTMHHHSGRLALFFEVRKWAGVVTNAEPDKCEALHWILNGCLPGNVVPYASAALQLIENGKTIGEFGWD